MSAAATDARARRAGRLRGLYAITPQRDDTASLARDVAAAIRGGAAAVQYRAKSLSAAVMREQADALAAVCREGGVLFIVNDDAALAREVGADGVHVGRDDAGVASARALAGDELLVGASCYDDLARAKELCERGADYVAFGSLFASAVKPHAVRASLDLVRDASRLPVPVVGIGGIDADNAASVIAAGAAAVAVITAVFDAPDVEAAARRIAEACASAAPSTNRTRP
jgi:thiamine-phosphate pyrophosphorylase